MDNDIIATTDDLIPAGVCPTGMKQWAIARGLNFQELVRNGLSVRELRETGCPYAAKVADAAERRVAAGGTV